MKTTPLITLFYLSFLYGPQAFSGTPGQLPAKGDSALTLTREVFQPNWAGFYSGWILGGQFGHSNDKTGPFGYNANDDQWSYNESGLNAAADFGFNYSLQQFVLGPEVELGYLGMGGSGVQPISPGGDTVGKSSSDLYTAFRTRLGVELAHYLLFATGGTIGVNYTKQVIDSCTIAPCGGSSVNAQKKNFIWGYTVGGGVEHLLEKGWSLKLEYLYFDLPRQSFNGTTNLGTSYDWSGQTSGHIIRGGLSHHF